MGTRKRTLLNGAAVSLGIAAMFLGGSAPAYAAVDAETNLSESTEVTEAGHKTTATFTWSVPDRTPAGTSFALTGFSSDLENPGNDVVNFLHPTSGALVATGVWAGNALNVTLTDFVTAHPLNIQGEATLVSEVTDPIDATPQPWYSPNAYECVWDATSEAETEPACGLTVGNGDASGESSIGRSLAKQSPAGPESVWLTELQMPIQWPTEGEGITGPVYVEYAALPGAPIDCSWNPILYVYQDNSLGSPGGILDSLPFEQFPFALQDVSCGPEGLSFTLPDGLPVGASFSVTVGGYVDSENPDFDYAKGYRWTNLEGTPAVEGNRTLSALGTAQASAETLPVTPEPTTDTPTKATSPERLANTGGPTTWSAYAGVAGGLILLGSVALLWRRLNSHATAGGS